MCVCLTINARKKFRIKNLHTLPNKTDGKAAMFLLQSGGRHICWYHDLPESQKRSFRPVRGNTPNHPITYSRPSQLSPGSTRPGSTLTRPCVNSSPVSTRPRVNSSLSQLVLWSTVHNSYPGQLEPGSTRPQVNVPDSTRPGSTRPRDNSSPCHTSSPSQLVLGSTRPRVNSNRGQLVPKSTRPRVNSPRSTRPRVNSSPCHTSSPSQLVSESTRPRVNSSSSQLVSRSTRPRVNSRLHLSLVNLHPCQLAPTSTRTRVIPQPSQLAPRSTRTQVPAYHTTHLPIYLHYLPPT